MAGEVRPGMSRGTTTGMIAGTTIDHRNGLQTETRGATTGIGVGALGEETETMMDTGRGMAIVTIGGIEMNIGAETGEGHDNDMVNKTSSRRLAFASLLIYHNGHCSLY